MQEDVTDVYFKASLRVYLTAFQGELVGNCGTLFVKYQGRKVYLVLISSGP